MTDNVCFDQKDIDINIFDNDLANWLNSVNYYDFNGVNFNLDSTFSIAAEFTGVLLETDDKYDHTTQTSLFQETKMTQTKSILLLN